MYEMSGGDLRMRRGRARCTRFTRYPGLKGGFPLSAFSFLYIYCQVTLLKESGSLGTAG